MQLLIAEGNKPYIEFTPKLIDPPIPWRKRVRTESPGETMPLDSAAISVLMASQLKLTSGQVLSMRKTGGLIDPLTQELKPTPELRTAFTVQELRFLGCYLQAAESLETREVNQASDYGLDSAIAVTAIQLLAERMLPPKQEYRQSPATKYILRQVRAIMPPNSPYHQLLNR